MKVVIANSVGINEKGERYIHFPSRWSAIEDPSWYDHSKGFMTFYPFGLAYCSSLLKRDTDHEVKFLDGHLNNWNHQTYLEKILAEEPDWLIMETSTLALADDTKLARAVKAATNAKVVMAGQHPSCYPDELLGLGADFVCRGEYELTVLELLQGRPTDKILGLYPNPNRPLAEINTFPWPEDDDVRRIDYMEPCVCDHREVEMIASRGCPLTCTFCVASNIYYGGRPSWRTRKVDDVVNEIIYLRKKYPEMQGIFFDDESHNGNKKFIISLTEAIQKAGLNDLHYNAMCGYWSLDRECLKAMRDAGYYKLRVGIETANQDIAKGINKGTVDIPRLYSVLDAAKDVGMRIYGTFTFGAPGSTKEKDLETTSLIVDLLDKGLIEDLQHTICTPQPGTPFFKYVEENGYLKTKDWSMFDGSRNVVYSYPHYTEDEIRETVRYTGEQINLHRGPVRFGKRGFDELKEVIKECGPKKVLLVRSGPVWQMNKVLAIIQETMEIPCIAIIAQPLVEQTLKSNPYVKDIFIYNQGFFNEGRYDDKLRRWIKEIGADLAVYLLNHNSDDKKDYRHVEALAELSGAPARVGVDITGKVIGKAGVRLI